MYGRSVTLGEAVLVREHDRMNAVAKPQRREDAADVLVDELDLHVVLLRDLGVRLPPRDAGEQREVIRGELVDLGRPLVAVRPARELRHDAARHLG